MNHANKNCEVLIWKLIGGENKVCNRMFICLKANDCVRVFSFQSFFFKHFSPGFLNRWNITINPRAFSLLPLGPNGTKAIKLLKENLRDSWDCTTINAYLWIWICVVLLFLNRFKFADNLHAFKEKMNYHSSKGKQPANISLVSWTELKKG